MNFMRSSIITILLISLTSLAAEIVNLVDGTTIEAEILQIKENQIYLQLGEKLFIIADKLIEGEAADFSGKINYNSFPEIITISSQKNLDKLHFTPHSKVKTKLEKNDFIYFELSSILNGLNGGIFYELFVHQSVGLSIGYYRVSNLTLGLLTERRSKINSFPLGILLVPQIQKQLNAELGFFVEYFDIKQTESSLFADETNTIEDKTEFKTSLKLGLRYQPELEGISFKGGGKLFLDKGIENFGVYFNLGLRF